MVNIIMATYNGGEYIREQIDSILNGTYKDICFFVQDDGSTDNTVGILKSYESKLSGRFFVHENEVNLRSAKNFFTCLLRAAAENAGSEDYYMFCDQDDVWDADKVEKTLSKMNELEKKYGKSDPLLVFTDSRTTDNDGNVIDPSFLQMSHFNLKALDLPHLLMENKAPGCTMMVNSALVNFVGNNGKILVPPQNMRMHDWWCMLVAASFGHIGVLTEATMSYRQHGNNVVGGKQFGSYVKEKMADTDGAKEALRKTILQGREFYELARGKSEHDEMLCAFAGLADDDFWLKREKIFKYHFFKSGLIRNLGLLVLI